MVNIKKVAKQVKENCDISDAKYWGIYSLCELLLRLRDLYKWEKELEPWIEVGPQEIMKWIDKREKAWEGLKNQKFVKIEIDEKKYDPFDTSDINKILKPKGYVYGAGYGMGMKPSFFLGELKESWREEGYNVHILGKELARDLSTSPAILRGKDIICRKEPLRYFLWDKIFEVKKTGKRQ